ncbi:hypothetical protein FYK55_14615 [Roseiconus nitratireducens]|uniref:Uncharacterized protein n=1 Tax=Roseiconus nitratireducens TaxID=2605748 RepID=A0A5M6D8D3_9BACT|nr:hypothetical protein [Roseiconus nitratireducens]KAA5542750.1 hypothetical protein FYK55_14615 [Roseiconus nitratireducens]
MNTPALYRHSGKVPPASLVMAAFILIPLGLLAGLLYSAAVVYLPFIKLRGLVTFFFGAGLGVIAGTVCYKLKYRNRLLVALTTLGFVAIAYYTSWAVHPALVIGAGELQEAFIPTLIQGFDPRMIIGWATLIFKEGIWGMGRNGGALSGWGAVIVWLIEAGLIFITAHVTAKTTFGDRPFCENCYRWNDETEELAVLPVATNDPAWDQVRNGNVDALKKLQIVPNQQGSYVELRLADCPTCDENDYLSAIGIVLTMDDGQLKKNETPIFRHLSISRDQRDEIVAFAAAMAEAIEEMNEADEIEDEDQVPQEMGEPETNA